MAPYLCPLPTRVAFFCPARLSPLVQLHRDVSRHPLTLSTLVAQTCNAEAHAFTDSYCTGCDLQPCLLTSLLSLAHSIRGLRSSPPRSRACPTPTLSLSCRALRHTLPHHSPSSRSSSSHGQPHRTRVPPPAGQASGRPAKLRRSLSKATPSLRTTTMDGATLRRHRRRRQPRVRPYRCPSALCPPLPDMRLPRTRRR